MWHGLKPRLSPILLTGALINSTVTGTDFPILQSFYPKSAAILMLFVCLILVSITRSSSFSPLQAWCEVIESKLQHSQIRASKYRSELLSGGSLPLKSTQMP